MKKFLSVILTVILALSAAFSLNVFAAEENIFNKIIDVPDLQEVLTQSEDAVDETLTDEDVEEEPAEDETEEPVPEEKVETRLEKWAKKMETCDEWGFNVSEGFVRVGDLVVKGDRAAAVQYTDAFGYNKIILDSSETYAYYCFCQFPYNFHVAVDLGEIISKEEWFPTLDEAFPGLTFVKAYEDSEGYVEEYIDGSMVVRFYFDGEDVTKISIPDLNTTLDFFYEVKDRAVEVPLFSVNLTPLLEMLVKLSQFITDFYMGYI